MSCNTRLWSGDNVFSGYERIFRNSPNAKLLFLPMELYREVVNVRKILKLDFDDTYQYSIAKYHGLKIVTMDKDFERIKDVETLFL
ncbi:DNA-binding protein [Petrotoga sp. 9T1HF07.CasAA.8.2]|uniref:type II toxin-antitoxin system VapC family toxin n=1 Tax=Petrotoga sp. 9T1HF07.CasAA.8.2 TaxID=1434329 RepID=UPI000CA7D7F4|nr:PIN domain-containing protein [Petrotoga sp. 9T1HF07.CasAA.8.2]PNR89233.1 DNA-binding protein [Petrotoga sp. 9T1HF07.CasAA.8.2]